MGVLPLCTMQMQCTWRPEEWGRWVTWGSCDAICHYKTINLLKTFRDDFNFFFVTSLCAWHECTLQMTAPHHSATQNKCRDALKTWTPRVRHPRLTNVWLETISSYIVQVSQKCSGIFISSDLSPELVKNSNPPSTHLRSLSH